MKNLKPTPFPSLLLWLECTEYLMEKLRARSGDATLHVLHQGWYEASIWDQETLKVPAQKVIYRDIIVTAWEQPCWYARTVLPEETYQKHAILFERLKTEPLGNLIFNEPSIDRLSIRYAPIEHQSVEYTWLTQDLHQDISPLWVRYSEFRVHKNWPFFLCEIMLPGLTAYL